MKVLKAVVLVLLLAVTGCKESPDMVAAAYATPATSQGRGNDEYYSMYSGANIPNSAPRGQVFEYQ